MNQSVEPVLAHAVLEREIVRDDFDRAIEEITRNGFTVVKDVLKTELAKSMQTKLLQVYERQVKEMGGEEVLQEIKDSHIVRTPLAYDPTFLEVVNHPIILKYLQKLLGSNFVLTSQVGILNSPEENLYQYAWHRDLQYQHFVASRPLAIQVLYCLDEFTLENGGTLVLPASHMFEKFPSDDYIRKHQIQIEAPKGSAIIFNSMLYHRAGINRSAHLRAAINHIYAMPIFQQQFDIPSMLGKSTHNEELSSILGYRWRAAPSVKQWREEHFARLPGKTQ
ncbi:MAG: Phytanoyl-CoA dioxygenase [Bacteriovoracaceae bacterium]|nr:Phytanoyl-CoA dioxygenase [Bacteriovoracaceae bacterium]